jgi:hypothetical protein
MIGAMETSDRRWRVEVGGVGSIMWYRLIGNRSSRRLPSLDALAQAMTDVGIDLSDLHEVDPATEPDQQSASGPPASPTD